ncbi:NO-inducible flavohemoprotein [Xylella taiwanensis]|uniref:nitric oxide dioxygenase n=1 Tax=Xylella taiwanensis TaxID=1444770 RepID=Z9JHT5_9GAMM|nr:NO-inducible flavohemoprotein [Xylella taiwanensis]AXI82512.1 dihydropteridine reductase [Xylella taiwanensis]EWS77386.1 dihydropteridine reductase [Xylella taiwanensis]MCD8455503.1 NO-inducible flavohemoprotein [Xylella taiwanensis]MCD8457910.1 NO-inducible flavohemoprotein [Xylella taiwanensis]MCD8460044.1 NO-inducible flavohemoprotein [Xylella taiwanensis]
MSTSLSPHTIAIIKATVPALAEHGTEIVAAMYRRLFEDQDIEALFNQKNQNNGTQIHALAAAILAYARNIDNLGVLGSAVERIAQKHVGYAIHPEHYPYVATALLSAIKEVLGDVATPEVLDAWGAAYWCIANLLKDREAVIREGITTQSGGWIDWRRFVIAQRIRESETITSFILHPEDRGAVVPHQAGQYLTVRFDTAGFPGMKRNYSISCGPNKDHYRITVKREAGVGVSAFLHDKAKVGTVIECTPPVGDFFLPDVIERPIVLLSGGVGLTPMVSMMEWIAAAHPEAHVWYVHGTHSRATHAMDAHIRALVSRHDHMQAATFYAQCSEADAANPGFITIDWLRANTPFQRADFYLCGPRPFLRAFVRDLIGAGVPAAQVHYELFGPTDEEMAA